jgi:hypothetical protein
MTACVSAPSGLETRGLDTLQREKAIDGVAMNAQDTPYTHSVEATVVDQPADRLRMDAKLVRNFTNADECRISAARRHAVPSLVQARPDCDDKLPHRHRAAELRLDPSVAANEERPGL